MCTTGEHYVQLARRRLRLHSASSSVLRRRHRSGHIAIPLRCNRKNTIPSEEQVKVLLIVVMYVTGAAWGPIVHTQWMPSALACRRAATAVVTAVDDASVGNMSVVSGGVSVNGRVVVKARCETVT